MQGRHGGTRHGWAGLGKDRHGRHGAVMVVFGVRLSEAARRISVNTQETQ